MTRLERLRQCSYSCIVLMAHFGQDMPILSNSAGSLREVDRLEDALAKAQAQQLSAEAALTHSSTEQQGQVQAAQQALQAASRDLTDCQARVTDLEATNAMLIQEAQVVIYIHSV